MMGYILFVAGGGPDGYGYMWFDQDDGVPYEWYDLGYPSSWQYQPVVDSMDASLAALMWIPTSAQTRIMGGDEAYNNTQTLPFNVTFFGTTYSAGTNFTVSTNGWLALASYTSAYFSNTSFPNSALPNNLIAPFWDDLRSRVWVGIIPDIRVYWTWWPDSNAALVVTWDSARHYSGSGPFVGEFQLIVLDRLDPNGNNVIVFIYKTPFTSSMTGSIGFENSTGTIGNSYTGVLSVGTTPNVTNFNSGVVVFNSVYIPGDPDVVVLGSGDDALFSSTLPFDVKFYGTTYTAGSTVKISTNGFLSFNPSITLSYSSNSSIPTTSAPNSLLAIWWDDNVVMGNIRHKVIGSSPNRKWVILFDSVRRYGSSGGNAKFQIIIYEETSITTGDNKIVFSYNTTNFGSATPNSTIGIENQSGNIGLPYTGSRITGSQPNISAILPNTSILFQTDVFTSISEASKSLDFSISKDGIKVKGKGKVEIYDVMGRRIFSAEVENSKVSFKDLSKGVYFVRIGDRTYKIIR